MNAWTWYFFIACMEHPRTGPKKNEHNHLYFIFIIKSNSTFLCDVNENSTRIDTCTHTHTYILPHITLNNSSVQLLNGKSCKFYNPPSVCGHNLSVILTNIFGFFYFHSLLWYVCAYDFYY